MTTEADSNPKPTGHPPVSDWTTDYDVLDADYVADPYPVWDDLREQCPIAHTERWEARGSPRGTPTSNESRKTITDSTPPTSAS